jgi:hypothetical protein
MFIRIIPLDYQAIYDLKLSMGELIRKTDKKVSS